MSKPRLLACVERWPACEEGEYNPACCRYPKSCSCTVYDWGQVQASDLEGMQPGDPIYEVGHAIGLNIDVTSAASVQQGVATHDAVMPIVEALVAELAKRERARSARPRLTGFDQQQIERGVSVLRVIADGLELLTRERP